MPDQGSEPGADESLGPLISGLRRQRRLSGTALGALVGMSQSKLSKIERGLVLAKPAEVRAIASALQASEAQTARMIQLAEQPRARQDRWRTVDPTTGAQQDIAGLESDAAEIRAFVPAVPPGLLHTAGYASALISEYTRPLEGDHEPRTVPAAVTGRMRRQEILADHSRMFLFVMAENALLNRVAGPAVMLAQVERLRSAATEPNISLRILLQDVQLKYPPAYDFELLDDRVAIVDTMTTTLVSRDADEIAVYRRVFEYFWEQGTEDIGPILDKYARLYADLARPADEPGTVP
jgi:transcriptional regulator with XRE-family HTH domain